MKVATQTITASCPDCGEDVDLGPRPQEGQMITCPECWAYLKVENLDPLILNWDNFELEDEDDEDEVN